MILVVEADEVTPLTLIFKVPNKQLRYECQ